MKRTLPFPLPDGDDALFCLVRHGETDWNRDKRIQGHLDVPLNDTGRRQALAVRRALAGIPFAAHYASDLARTLETARLILGEDAPLQPHPGLRERHCGHFQGLLPEEAERLDPQGYARYASRDPHYRPLGGEALLETFTRIGRTLDELARAHRGEAVLLVTHGGVLDAVRRHVEGLPLERKRDFPIPNCGLSWVRWGQQRAILAWAETSHLEASARDEIAAM